LSDDFVRAAVAGVPVGVHGFRPDYGSGSYLLLVAAAVDLARRDLSHPLYSASARWFLENSDLVDLFAECLGIDAQEFTRNV